MRNPGGMRQKCLVMRFEVERQPLLSMIKLRKRTNGGFIELSCPTDLNLTRDIKDRHGIEVGKYQITLNSCQQIVTQLLMGFFLTHLLFLQHKDGLIHPAFKYSHTL